MITILYNRAELQVQPPGAHMAGHACNHIIVDARDKEMPGWEDYMRGTLQTRLLWHGSILYYPSPEAYEMLCSASGLELPRDTPLSFWEDVIKALGQSKAVPDMLEAVANKYGYTATWKPLTKSGSPEGLQFDPIETNQ